jgi:hypothetical protein
VPRACGTICITSFCAPGSDMGAAPVPATKMSSDHLGASTSGPASPLRQQLGPGRSVLELVPSQVGGQIALRTRLQDGIRKPKIYSDDTIRYGHSAISKELITLQAALSNPNWKAPYHQVKTRSYAPPPIILRADYYLMI